MPRLPLGEFFFGFWIGWWVKTDDAGTCLNLFGHKIFKGGHIGCFSGNVGGHMRGNKGHALSVTDHNFAGKNSDIRAGDGRINGNGLMQGQIGGGRRPLTNSVLI